ncbi:hypothetical protein [Marinicrinis lubricantis]|uniref:Uncharacterized protein n=1 Tax=Marinicrinis lubricantis TaxID=2086470 RepID=A0ABW1IPC2_9BACL
MRSKLILIEGLPGFGKSTTAQIVNQLLAEHKVDTRLFLEGDLQHPADYDGVACLTKEQFEAAFSDSSFYQLFLEYSIQKGDELLVPYRKICDEHQIDLSDEVFQTIFQQDIYELPLQKNIELITDRWSQFGKTAAEESTTYVFECCFIQNPVTVSMVKYNAPEEIVSDYVLKLEQAIRHLDPLLIYIEQDHLETVFHKASKERESSWLNGFVDYYTGQGFGLENGFQGIEGTIQVLKHRQQLEQEIVNKLHIETIVLNNSQFDQAAWRQKLRDILNPFL